MIAAPPPNVIPTPIGVGSAYRPPALTQAVEAGRPVAALRCGATGMEYALLLGFLSVIRKIACRSC